MARYLLLVFDDDNEADNFIEAIQAPGRIMVTKPIGVDEDGNMHYRYEDLQGVTVRAMYMKPTQFCTCREDGKWGKNDGWARGQKYGLYVHSRCGKPSRTWVAGDHWYTTHGKNLLPVSADAPEWRGVGIAHHRFDEATKQWVHVETGEVWTGERKQS